MFYFVNCKISAKQDNIFYIIQNSRILRKINEKIKCLYQKINTRGNLKILNIMRDAGNVNSRQISFLKRSK